MKNSRHFLAAIIVPLAKIVDDTTTLTFHFVLMKLVVINSVKSSSMLVNSVNQKTFFRYMCVNTCWKQVT